MKVTGPGPVRPARMVAAAACALVLSACATGGDDGARRVAGGSAASGKAGDGAAALPADCGSDPRGNGELRHPSTDPTAPQWQPSAEPTPTGASLPSSVKILFNDWTAGNGKGEKAEQDVLDAAATAERRTYALTFAEALTEGSDDEEVTAGDEAVLRLFGETFAKGSPAWRCRKAYAFRFHEGLSLFGRARFFDPRVTVAVDGASATTQYCADFRRISANSTTSTKTYALAEPGVFPRYSTKLEKDGDGNWKTVEARAETDGCTENGRT